MASSRGCDHEQCWICLDDASEDGSRQLVSPCKCPRKVHPQCLARWQLQQAGRHEEKFCRFCNSNLEDWKANLTPKNLAPEIAKVQPVMVVYFEGQIHRIPVKQGPEGLAEFQGKIRSLFRLPEDVDISLTFGCKEPMSGQHLKLEGVGAFDAAVHCASVAAADRQQRVKRSQSVGDLAGAAQGASRSASGSAATTPPAAAAPAAPVTPVAARAASVSRSSSSQALSAMVAGTATSAPRGGGRSRSFNVPPRSPLQLPALAAITGRGSPPPAAPATPPQLAVRAASVPGGFRSAFAAAAAAASRRTASPLPLSEQQPQPDEAEAAANAAAGGGAGPKHEQAGDNESASGSLGDRLKGSFKSFSRRVVRSLSFTSGNSSSRGSGGSPPAAPAASNAPLGGAGPSASASPVSPGETLPGALA